MFDMLNSFGNREMCRSEAVPMRCVAVGLELYYDQLCMARHLSYIILIFFKLCKCFAFAFQEHRKPSSIL